MNTTAADCREAYAPHHKVWCSDDQLPHVSGEFYVFGSLVIAVFEDMSLVVAVLAHVQL